jgi:hypothetical protein
MRKSAAHLQERATFLSKACVITTTGGVVPMRAISRSNACISPLLAGIEVDDGNGRPPCQLGFKPGQRAGNNQDDLIAGAEGFARLRLGSCPQ